MSLVNYPNGMSSHDWKHIEYDGGESPDEQASARFYASLEVEPSGAMVISNGSGHVFWWVCGLCAGDEVRKAPRRYGDWAEAQHQADLHNEVSHRERTK